MLIIVTALGGLLIWVINLLRALTREVRQLRREMQQLQPPPPLVVPHFPAETAPFVPEPQYSDQIPLAGRSAVKTGAQSLLASVPPTPRPGFFARHPDWEKFIGENLINKLGMAVLVLGIGFFVKYAIDQEWINAGGRVLIGLACGLGLLVLAHWLRAGYAAFSSVLVGGGLAVLYFTVALAFQQYQLVSQTVAFLLMVAVTGLSVALALGYNRQELAVLALLGGFASPLLASSGGGNYVVLFSYVLILNVGMLVLAYFKKWPSITVIAYVATVILFAGWLVARVIGELAAPYAGGLLFAALFYLVFFAMTVVYNLKVNQPFSLLQIGILLSNTAFFYLAAVYLLGNLAGGAYQGVFSGGLAFFNGAAAWQLRQKTNIDRKLIYLLGLMSVLLLYLAILLELTYRLGATTTEMREIKLLVLICYHYVFAVITLRFLPATWQARWPLLEMMTLGSIFTLVALVHPTTRAARDAYLLQPAASMLPFALHYPAVLLLLLILRYAYQYYRRAFNLKSKQMIGFIWLASATLVFIASAELDHLLLLLNFAPGKSIATLLRQQHQIGFPILWGLSSFVLMLVGMRYKVKPLRLVSLTLFFVTLLKLFIFDLQNISAGGRIAAFISLGILLLVVSFLYQKLKVLLLDDDAK